MCDDEGPDTLEESIGSDAVGQHPENAGALAVSDRIETLHDTRDITVVLLHHWMAIFLRVRLPPLVHEQDDRETPG